MDDEESKGFSEIKLNEEGVEKMPLVLELWYNEMFKGTSDPTKRPVFPDSLSPFRKLTCIPEKMCAYTQSRKSKEYKTFRLEGEKRVDTHFNLLNVEGGSAVKPVNLTAHIEGMKTIVELLNILYEKER